MVKLTPEQQDAMVSVAPRAFAPVKGGGGRRGATSVKSRRHYWFGVIVSALTCVICTFNTGVAGITSLVILLQRGVRETFDRH